MVNFPAQQITFTAVCALLIVSKDTKAQVQVLRSVCKVETGLPLILDVEVNFYVLIYFLILKRDYAVHICHKSLISVYLTNNRGNEKAI